MSREIHVKGMVLQSAPYAEYDRRVVFGLKKVFLFHKVTMDGIRL